MKIEKLSIRNFRNIEDLSIQCGKGIHFIYGQNAQGKTSILEAISLLSHLKSFRDSEPEALIQTGCHQSSVRGEFSVFDDAKGQLKVELALGPRRVEKRAYINEKLTRSTGEYWSLKSGSSPLQFHAISLNPTSTDLLRLEPAGRRSYLNQVVSAENPSVLEHLKRYQKALDQKNAHLKQERWADDSFLAVLNETLVKEGAILIQERMKFIEKIRAPILDFLRQIAPGQSEPKMIYFSKLLEAQPLYFNGHFEVPSLEFLEELFNQELRHFGAVERQRKTSLVGPHRDDFRVQAGASNHNIAEVGSQGEIRSFLLALKLAELEQFRKATGIQPVLLIDDFSSELDQRRRGFLLDYLKESPLQIFVTSTDHPAALAVGIQHEGSNPIRMFRVSQGTLADEGNA